MTRRGIFSVTIRLSLIAIWLLWLAPHASASDAEELFTRGYQSYRERHFAEAITSFRQAYELQRDSRTAYWIAICFYNARDLPNAKRYAKLALQDPPGLEELFRGAAQKIIRQETQETVDLGGKADAWSPPVPKMP